MSKSYFSAFTNVKNVKKFAEEEEKSNFDGVGASNPNFGKPRFDNGKEKGFITDCGQVYFNNRYWSEKELIDLKQWLQEISKK